MKIVTQTILILFLAFFTSVAYPSEPSNVPSSELEALSVQWMDSMLRHDKVRLEELMAPDFVLHTTHPEYPETSRERWLDNLFKHIEINKWEQTDISARTYGDIGVVTSLYEWSGSMFKEPFDAKGHCTDVWRFRIKQWKVVSRTCIEF